MFILIKRIFVEEGKRNRSDSSDKENETVKKRRLLDSDEEEPLMSQNTELKEARTIISDDEEGPSQKQRNQQRKSRVMISDDED